MLRATSFPTAAAAITAAASPPSFRDDLLQLKMPSLKGLGEELLHGAPELRAVGFGHARPVQGDDGLAGSQSFRAPGGMRQTLAQGRVDVRRLLWIIWSIWSTWCSLPRRPRRPRMFFRRFTLRRRVAGVAGVRRHGDTAPLAG
jgi:hypothetical protein